MKKGTSFGCTWSQKVEMHDYLQWMTPAAWPQKAYEDMYPLRTFLKDSFRNSLNEWSESQSVKCQYFFTSHIRVVHTCLWMLISSLTNQALWWWIVMFIRFSLNFIEKPNDIQTLWAWLIVLVGRHHSSCHQAATSIHLRTRKAAFSIPKGSICLKHPLWSLY